MHGNVSQNLLRNVRIRRINRHTAAIRMVDCYHIIHIRIFRQNLPLDSLDCNIQHTGDTLHGSVDTQNISCPRIASSRVAIPHPGGSLRFWQIRSDIGGKFHLIKIRCRSHDEIFFIDPAALGDILGCRPQYYPIADDLGALGQVHQRNFMRLWNIRRRNDAGHHLCPLLKVMDRDCDIVFIRNTDTKLISHCSLHKYYSIEYSFSCLMYLL